MTDSNFRLTLRSSEPVVPFYHNGRNSTPEERASAPSMNGMSDTPRSTGDSLHTFNLPTELRDDRTRTGVGVFERAEAKRLEALAKRERLERMQKKIIVPWGGASHPSVCAKAREDLAACKTGTLL